MEGCPLPHRSPRGSKSCELQTALSSGFWGDRWKVLWLRHIFCPLDSWVKFVRSLEVALEGKRRERVREIRNSSRDREENTLREVALRMFSKLMRNSHSLWSKVGRVKNRFIICMEILKNYDRLIAKCNIYVIERATYWLSELIAKWRTSTIENCNETNVNMKFI